MQCPTKHFLCVHETEHSFTSRKRPRRVFINEDHTCCVYGNKTHGMEAAHDKDFSRCAHRGSVIVLMKKWVCGGYRNLGDYLLHLVTGNLWDKCILLLQAFVEHYYRTFDTNRSGLLSLYQEQCMLTFEGQQIQVKWYDRILNVTLSWWCKGWYEPYFESWTGVATLDDISI